MPSDSELGAIAAQLAAVHTETTARSDPNTSIEGASAAAVPALKPRPATASEAAPPPVPAPPITHTVETATATAPTHELNARAHQAIASQPYPEESYRASIVALDAPQSLSQSTETGPRAVAATSPTCQDELPSPPQTTDDEPTSAGTPSSIPDPSSSVQSVADLPTSSTEFSERHVAPGAEAGAGAGAGVGAAAAIEPSVIPRIATSSLPPVAPTSTSITPAAPIETSQPNRASPQDQEQEEQWLLKTIVWPPLPRPLQDMSRRPTRKQSRLSAKISTGRVPLLPYVRRASAVCLGVILHSILTNSFSLTGNVLLLRHSISLPSHLDRVSYSDLSSILADHLLQRSNTEGFSASISSALSTLPSTRYGLDLNPRFGSIDGFTPSPAVSLFKAFEIPLLHGWCVDPDERSGETWNIVVENGEDYDSVVEKIVRGRELSGGQLEGEMRTQDEDEVVKAVERSSKWTVGEAKAVREAHILHAFLSSTSTQLTYHGLMLLSSSLSTSSLSTLFRNSHVSVLYRRPGTPDTPTPDPTHRPLPRLFTLVTDSAFVHEPEIVWESLEDVDGSASEFYDGDLRKSMLREGDYVGSGSGGGGGRKGASSMPRGEGGMGGSGSVEGGQEGRTVRINHDEDLARQLQFEEERWRVEDDERRVREMQRREWEDEQQQQQYQHQQQHRAHGQSSSNVQAPTAQSAQAGGKKEAKAKKAKTGKDCLIM
ncbi:BQ5605_C014g07529 [Microbotryum silenes-dioicae]|uniref:BQ5605_C014g07529 protein n=1 Tax=Microbotryum silenes-dioicae TaxID=796604 RepID=A0A2X0MNK1_9BASI|nr:BQ5605_C014g07529 [Microbotryum silenes-dioicae]